MTDAVRTDLANGIATIALDDGKANAIGPARIDELTAALDAAEKEARVVVIRGRPGRFSAGFDLSVLGQGGAAARALVTAGAELCLRLLEYPLPVVAACSGHALAEGVLLVSSCDYRIGARGAFKVGLNEVAIGMALPHFGREIARARLSKRHLFRAVNHAEIYDPEGALDAGYFDELAEPGQLEVRARTVAEGLAKLDPRAFARTKRALIAETVAGIRRELAADMASLLPDG